MELSANTVSIEIEGKTCLFTPSANELAGSRKTDGNGKMTCFICNCEQDANSTTNWSATTLADLSKCLCKLFNLKVVNYIKSFMGESYCTKCQELFEVITIIYEELEKLYQELDEKRQFVELQLTQSYKANLCKINELEDEEELDSDSDVSNQLIILESRIQLLKAIIRNKGSATPSPNLNKLQTLPPPKNEKIVEESNQAKSNDNDNQRSPNQSTELPQHNLNPPTPVLIEIKVEPREDLVDEYEGITGENDLNPSSNDSNVDTPPNQPIVKLSRVQILETTNKPHQRTVAGKSTSKTGEHPNHRLKIESDLEKSSISRRTRTRVRPEENYSQYFMDASSGEDEEYVPDDEIDVEDGDWNEDDEESDTSLTKARASCPKSKRLVREKFICKICGRDCYCASKLERHQNSHSDEKRYTCEICGKPFKTSFAAKSHEITHSQPADPANKPYKCPVAKCQFDYFSQRGLRKHLNRRHRNYSAAKRNSSSGESSTVNEKPKRRPAPTASGRTGGMKFYSCSICGKVCKSPYDLNYHEESHKPDHERRNVCNVCGKGFFKHSVLQKHQLKHANIDLLNPLAGHTLCQICGKYVTQLKTHMRSHTGEKLFPCKICDKSFGTRESVRVHSRIHTGEKPFECSECGMKFRTSQSYRRHTKVHISEKSYICDHCGKAFRLKQSLREHLHVHTKEAPHRCNICGKRFAEQVLLNEHVNKDHTIEQIERKKKSSSTRRRKDGTTATSTGAFPQSSVPFLHEQSSIAPPQISPHLLGHEDNTNSSSASVSSSAIPVAPAPRLIERTKRKVECVDKNDIHIPTATTKSSNNMGHGSSQAVNQQMHHHHHHHHHPLSFSSGQSSTHLFPPYFPFTTNNTNNNSNSY